MGTHLTVPTGLFKVSTTSVIQAARAGSSSAILTFFALCEADIAVAGDMTSAMSGTGASPTSANTIDNLQHTTRNGALHHKKRKRMEENLRRKSPSYEQTKWCVA